MKMLIPLILSLLLLIGCGSDTEDGDAAKYSTPDSGTDDNGNRDANTTTSIDAGADTNSYTRPDANADTSFAVDADDASDICESATVQASVDPVNLIFAFDVSGSMGQEDYPWHDRELKWEPVVAAISAFLSDPLSEGIWASMTFFPSENEDDKCEDETYVEPDIPLTALPSEVFEETIEAIGEQEWRGRTPTLHVLNGVLRFIEESREENDGKYAVVLVTDGYPSGCADNEIATVVDVAEEAAEDGVLTYVIGVNNPPIEGAPDTVSSLEDIAIGGGTNDAFIIDTGDPEMTTQDFTSAIQEIRSSSLSCTIQIPPPPGDEVFDKQKVRITVEYEDEQLELAYDSTCNDSNSWRYDDVDDPTEIVLCDETCEKIQDAFDPTIRVEFTCENVIIII